MTRLGAGFVLTEGALVPADVEVVDGQVAALAEPTRGSGRVVAPGFVDLQVNGFAGVDFAAASVAEVGRAARALWHAGTTAFCPTLTTAAVPALRAGLDVIDHAVRAGPEHNGAQIVGAHLEGPFLAPTQLGTHQGAHRLDPDPAILETLLAAGPVARMTLAPELPGALDLVQALVERTIGVSAGHSAATADEAHLGFDAGIDAVTHLGNAMTPFHHRAPGLFGASLVRRDVTPTLIADGAHVAADTTRLVFAATRGRVALVSDAVSIAGTEAASGRVGDVRLRRDGHAARNEDGGLAGGLRTLAEMVRLVVDLGIDRGQALAAASAHPRRLERLPHASGVEPGQPADLVVLDDDLGVTEVIRPYA